MIIDEEIYIRNSVNPYTGERFKVIRSFVESGKGVQERIPIFEFGDGSQKWIYREASKYRSCIEKLGRAEIIDPIVARRIKVSVCRDELTIYLKETWYERKKRDEQSV